MSITEMNYPAMSLSEPSSWKLLLKVELQTTLFVLQCLVSTRVPPRTSDRWLKSRSTHQGAEGQSYQRSHGSWLAVPVELCLFRPGPPHLYLPLPTSLLNLARFPHHLRYLLTRIRIGHVLLRPS